MQRSIQPQNRPLSTLRIRTCAAKTNRQRRGGRDWEEEELARGPDLPPASVPLTYQSVGKGPPHPTHPCTNKSICTWSIQLSYTRSNCTPLYPLSVKCSPTWDHLRQAMVGGWGMGTVLGGLPAACCCPSKRLGRRASPMIMHHAAAACTMQQKQRVCMATTPKWQQQQQQQAPAAAAAGSRELDRHLLQAHPSHPRGLPVHRVGPANFHCGGSVRTGGQGQQPSRGTNFQARRRGWHGPDRAVGLEGVGWQAGGNKLQSCHTSMLDLQSTVVRTREGHLPVDVDVACTHGGDLGGEGHLVLLHRVGVAAAVGATHAVAVDLLSLG